MRVVPSVLTATLIFELACASGATSDPGYDQTLQVLNAQFRPGSFPQPSGGPETTLLFTPRSTIEIGQLRDHVHAVMGTEAHAAIVGMAGVDGAWIVVAGPPDVNTPDMPSMAAVFGLNAAAAPGPFTLLVAASDGGGRIGVPGALDLTAAAPSPPDGDLVVSLSWLGAADLDLHVVDGAGGEAWNDHPTTYRQPGLGAPPDPDGYLSSGILDRDKNANCRRDNSDGEHVIWATRSGPTGTVTPIIPAGMYTVRVDTRSLCGDGGASWCAAAYAGGTKIGEACGVSTSEDVLTGTHRAGAGVTALTFTRP